MKRKLIMHVIALISILFYSMPILAQNHRYKRYDGAKDGNIGLKALLIGGAIWGLGMLLGKLFKKNENGKIAEGQSVLYRIVEILVVGGALIAAFGLIMFGF